MAAKPPPSAGWHLVVAAIEHRFGMVNRLPVTIEWVSDNGSCYLAGNTRSLARDIGLEPRTAIESPQSDVRTSNATTLASTRGPMLKSVMRQLSS